MYIPCFLHPRPQCEMFSILKRHRDKHSSDFEITWNCLIIEFTRWDNFPTSKVECFVSMIVFASPLNISARKILTINFSWFNLTVELTETTKDGHFASNIVNFTKKLARLNEFNDIKRQKFAGNLGEKCFCSPYFKGSKGRNERKDIFAYPFGSFHFFPLYFLLRKRMNVSRG